MQTIRELNREIKKAQLFLCQLDRGECRTRQTKNPFAYSVWIPYNGYIPFKGGECNMRCPYCGSPVESDGPWWVCYWCGSSCDPEPVREAEQTPTVRLTLSLSLVYRIDLAETWGDLKKALGQLAPKSILLSQLLGKVLLHHISAGIQHAGALPDEKKAEELRTFLTTTTDLNLGESAEKIMRDAKRGVLFCEEAALSETDCGTFWTELFAARPVEDYYNNVEPDELYELLHALSSACAYFGAEAGEEVGEAQDQQRALRDAYDIYWQNKVLLHPDVGRAKRLLAAGDFPKNEDICREILLVEYPEEVPHETAEDLDELSWERVLDNVFADDPENGMEMWRHLLNIAEPSLKANAKTAEKLLPDWDWLESPTDDQALSLLVALEDEQFTSQLFESAYIGRSQFNVLEICRDCGEETMARHCMDLALKNPGLEERWRKRYTQALTAAPFSKRIKAMEQPFKSCQTAISLLPSGTSQSLPAMKILPAEVKDIPALYQLQLLAFESEAAMIESRDVPALQESAEENRADFANWNTLKLENDTEEIIGSIRYRQENDVIDVSRLMVHPDYRHQGLAQKLLSEVDKLCAGKTKELYTCTKSWINIRLYKKMGYKAYKECLEKSGLSFIYMRKK